MIRRHVLPLACALALVAFAGCKTESEPPQADAPAKTATAKPKPTTEAEKKSEASAAEPVTRPPDLPTLAELDAKVSWKPAPVVNALSERWELDRSQTAQVSDAEALAMRNTSPETNAKIVSALGRLPKDADDPAIDWDSSISRRFPQDLRSTNPLLTSSTTESIMNSITGYGLFSFDWNMKPFAAAETVKEWWTSEDGLYDKLILRDDVVWSDGTPITAHDVVFSFLTIMDPEVPVPSVRGGTDEIRWAEAYDDQTLVYFHKAPLVTNNWNMNHPVIPKHIYEESIKDDKSLRTSAYHAKVEANPLAGGPYEIVKRARGQEVVVQRRESWYMHDGKQVRDKPFIKEMRFRVIEDPNTALLALKKGELDEGELQPEQWRTQTTDADFYRHNTKVTGREWTYFYFAWNTKAPYFRDKRVRQAMSYAFNHDEMLDELCYGLYERSRGIWHPSSWMHPKTPTVPYQQDLDKAEALLEEAGWTDSDGDGVLDKEIDGHLIQFEFSLVVSNKADRIAICNLLRENLSSIGINVNVTPLESATLQERMFSRNFEAAYSGWGTGADPATSENIWGSGKGRNYVSFDRKEIDDLFAAGLRAFDQDERAKAYARIHEIIWEEQPYTFLFYRASFYGFNKRLRGYKFSPRGPFSYGPGVLSIWASEN